MVKINFDQDGWQVNSRLFDQKKCHAFRSVKIPYTTLIMIKIVQEKWEPYKSKVDVTHNLTKKKKNDASMIPKHDLTYKYTFSLLILKKEVSPESFGEMLLRSLVYPVSYERYVTMEKSSAGFYVIPVTGKPAQPK